MSQTHQGVDRPLNSVHAPDGVLNCSRYCTPKDVFFAHIYSGGEGGGVPAPCEPMLHDCRNTQWRGGNAGVVMLS